MDSEATPVSTMFSPTEEDQDNGFPKLAQYGRPTQT